MVKINASHEGAAKLMASKDGFGQVVELRGERETGDRVVKEGGWERLLSPETGNSHEKWEGYAAFHHSSAHDLIPCLFDGTIPCLDNTFNSPGRLGKKMPSEKKTISSTHMSFLSNSTRAVGVPRSLLGRLNRKGTRKVVLL